MVLSCARRGFRLEVRRNFFSEGVLGTGTAAIGSVGVNIPGGVEEPWGCGTEGHTVSRHCEGGLGLD